MAPISGLDLAPLHLDDMDFVITDNSVVVTKDSTIAELIKSVSEGAAVGSASNTD